MKSSLPLDEQTWLFKPQIPVHYANTVLACAEKRGLDIKALKKEIGLDDAILVQHKARILPVLHWNLVNAVLRETGNNGLGFEVGLSLPLTSHSNLGFAVMCASNLDEVFKMLNRFWHLQETVISLSTHVEDNYAVITLDTHLPMEPQVESVYFECLLTVLFRSMQVLLSNQNIPGELCLRGQEPEYVKLFNRYLPTLRFGMPSWQLRVPLELMGKTLPMHNKEMLKFAVSRCEEELGILLLQPNIFSARVEQLLVLNEKGYLSQEEIAERLGISYRTMRRRLNECRTSYRQLKEKAVLRDAMYLLEFSDLSIHAISLKLGYSSLGNFSRAFRGWVAHSPQEYRKKRRGYNSE